MDFNKDDIVISIKNVSKFFGDQSVLNNLNFDVRKNKITTILGFSGAGKSTLMKIILGLMAPTAGVVKVLGKNINSMKDSELNDFRQNFGMLFQYAALFDSMTAYDNVAFPMREFTDHDESSISTLVGELLGSVNIDKFAYSKFPSELSGGMRKRVGLARALSLSPAIMLYDEPTTGLDPISTKRVNDLIVDTAKNNSDRGMTSIIISHDVQASLKISDYVAFLDHGRIIEYLPVSEFIHSENPLVREFLEL